MNENQLEKQKKWSVEQYWQFGISFIALFNVYSRDTSVYVKTTKRTRRHVMTNFAIEMQCTKRGLAIYSEF